MARPCHTPGKNTYRSKALAEKALRDPRTTTISIHPPTSVYRCRSCGLWHLTSSTRRKARR